MKTDRHEKLMKARIELAKVKGVNSRLDMALDIIVRVEIRPISKRRKGPK